MPHQPFSRIVDNSDTAILFIHGIVGSPNQFRNLLPMVPPEWSCVNLLLPGHGGSVRDFARSSMNEWRSYVARQVDELAATHRRILLVGHSMGTLFCIDEALRHSEKVAGLFLLAAPLYPRLTPSAAYQSLQVAFGKTSSKPTLQAAYDACSVTATAKLWQYLGWLPRFAELFQAANQGRKQIRELSTPVVSVHSQHDELVSPRSCGHVEKLPYVALHILPAAGHFYYPPEDMVTLQNLFGTFIKKYQ